MRTCLQETINSPSVLICYFDTGEFMHRMLFQVCMNYHQYGRLIFSLVCPTVLVRVENTPLMVDTEML